MRFLEPPVFDSEEQSQHARMFHTVACTTMLVAILFILPIMILLPGFTVRGLTTIVFVNTMGVILLVLNRWGRTRSASLLFVGGLILLIAALASTAGGIRAPAVTFNLIIVMMAGLLLGERIGIFTGIICMAVGLGFVLVESWGVLPAPMVKHTALSLWLINALFIGIVIALQKLATGTVRNALDRDERELAEREQAEERLRAVTQRLQLALEAAEIGVWDWDLQTNQVVYADRLFAMYGLSPTPDKVVSYDDWARQVHPQDLPQQEAALSRLASAAERRRRDFRIIRPDGTIRYVQSAGAVITNDQGQPLRLI
jgi:PAS domain-containing protein